MNLMSELFAGETQSTLGRVGLRDFSKGAVVFRPLACPEFVSFQNLNADLKLLPPEGCSWPPEDLSAQDKSPNQTILHTQLRKKLRVVPAWSRGG